MVATVVRTTRCSSGVHKQALFLRGNVILQLKLEHTVNPTKSPKLVSFFFGIGRKDGLLLQKMT